MANIYLVREQNSPVCCFALFPLVFLNLHPLPTYTPLIDFQKVISSACLIFFFKTLDLYRKENAFERGSVYSHSYIENVEESTCCLCSDSIWWIANCCFLWKDYAKLKSRKARFGRLSFLDSSPTLLCFCSTLSQFSWLSFFTRVT